MARNVSIIVLLLVIGGIAWAVLRKPAPAPTQPTPPVAVRVAPVVQAEVARWVPVIGSLIARDELAVAPEIVGGRIIELLADVGDRVAAGQVVIRLDPATARTQLAQVVATQQRSRAAVAQQQAMIVEAQASLADAEASLQRAEAAGVAVVSEETRAQRGTAVAVARARVAAAEQSLELAKAEVAQAAAQAADAELSLARTELRAPAAGVVLERNAKLGAVANAGEVLLRLAQDGRTEFAAEVTEDLMALVAIDQPVTLSAGGVDGRGTVRRIDPAVDPITRLGVVRIALEGADTALRPGLSARGRIRVATGSGTVVPAGAVMDDGAGSVVMVVADGRAVRRAITGLLRADDRILAGGGIAVGEMVVSRAPNFISDGEAVVPVAEEAPKAGR